MDNGKFYITTPIYYVNDRPHIGHAYTTILADVLARFHRSLGDNTFFLTGTDEHGQKVEKAAAKNNMDPLVHCDETVVRFQELWKKLGITNDKFIRTTQDFHKKVVQTVLQDLYDRGEIYRAEYTGWYCVGDERFFTEKDLVDGKCPECGREVTAIQESNYFFKMGSTVTGWSTTSRLIRISSCPNSAPTKPSDSCVRNWATCVSAVPNPALPGVLNCPLIRIMSATSGLML